MELLPLETNKLTQVTGKIRFAERLDQAQHLALSIALRIQNATPTTRMTPIFLTGLRHFGIFVRKG